MPLGTGAGTLGYAPLLHDGTQLLTLTGQLETSLPVGLFIYLLSHSFGVKRVIAHNWVYFCSSSVHIFLMMALKYLNIHRKYLKQSLGFHLCINLKIPEKTWATIL